LSRIAETFGALRARREIALLPYLTVGFPSVEATVELGAAIVRAGADGLELGIAFSDPLADGATLQRASQQALDHGVRLADAFEVVRRLRAAVSVPLVFMSYYNPVQRHGVERFCALAAQAGADGLIVPDLPAEEAAPLQAACDAVGLSLIAMVAPTTPDDRIAAACADASGFIYCVALVGVTGARASLADDLPVFLDRVRKCAQVPLVVGFGISRPEHVAALAGSADGAIVASALADLIDRTPPEERVAAAGRYVAELKAACHVPSRASRAPS
jgi:tryptophan synthase alpha chain